MFSKSRLVLLLILFFSSSSMGQDIDWGDPFVDLTQEAVAVGITATDDTIQVPENVPGVFDTPFELGILAVDYGISYTKTFTILFTTTHTHARARALISSLSYTGCFIIEEFKMRMWELLVEHPVYAHSISSHCATFMP